MVMKGGPELLKKIPGLMDPADVGREIAAAIFSCRGGQLVIPPNQWWLVNLRFYPSWVQEYIGDGAAALL